MRVSGGPDWTPSRRSFFDQNLAIATPAIFNTLDAGGPSSSVTVLPVESYPGFLVSWTGDDEGSGIGGYDVYVSMDGGDFEPWLSGTSLTEAEFDQAEIGHTYAFYSVATDRVGYKETAPATADTQTLVVETPSVEVVAVDVVSTATTVLAVEFAGSMGLQAMIDDGSITSAVTLISVAGEPVVLTADQYSYDDGAKTLTIQIDPALPIDYYELSLDGSLITNTEGHALRGGASGLVFELGTFGAEQAVQTDGADLQVEAYSVPSLVDYNADGLTDLLVGEKTAEGEGKIRVYLNQGSNEAPVYSTFAYAQTTGTDVVVPGSGCLGAFPRMHDLTDDGVLDMVIGLADGRVQLWENAGTNAAPAFAQPDYLQVGEPGSKTEINVGGRATLAITDWNGDGRDDLVLGGMDGRVRVFLDERTAGMPDFRSEQIVQDGDHDLVLASGRSSVAVADLNGDGRDDLIVGDTDGTLRYYPNKGTRSAPAFDGWQALKADGVEIDLAGTPRSRPFVGDFNGDGLLDLLVGAQDGLVRLYAGLTAGGPTQLAEPVQGDVAGWYTQTFEAAKTIPDLGTITFEQVSGVDPSSAEAWYRVTASQDGLFTIVATPVGGTVGVSLYDLSQTEPPLATSTDADGNQRLDHQVTAGTSYLVQLSGTSSNVDLTLVNLVQHTGTTLTVSGTDQNDTFKFFGHGARNIEINGISYHYEDTEVSAVEFTGGDGFDDAWLYDSTGNERLEAWPDRAVFENDGDDGIADFTVNVSGIESLLAYATRGGTDSATLHGSEAADKLKSYEDSVRLRAKDNSYASRAKRFDTVTADAGTDGNDLAVFNGTDGDETFRYDGVENVARIEASGRDHAAVGFGTVVARAGSGDGDVAYFTDSDADDVLYFKSHKTVLVNPNVKITARAFDEAHATADQDGFDVARIYDTAGDEYLEVIGDTASLYRKIDTERDLMYAAIGFERVKAYRTEGDDTKDVNANHTIADLILYDWDK